MPHHLSASTFSRVRMALLASLFLSLILLVAFALPSISRATRESRSSQTSNGQTTKHRPKRPEFVPGEILVRYRSEKAAQRQPRTAMVQSAEGRAIQIQVEAFRGSHIVEGLRIARVAAPDTMQAIAALKSQSDVLYAEPNYILHKETLPNDPRFPELYGLRNTGQNGGTPGADIHAEQAWSINTGSRSVVVGVIDEGIDINHPDLKDNIWINSAEIPGNGIDDDGNGFIDDIHGWDFSHDDSTVFDGASDMTNQTDAHGTHVAGTIGAVGNNGMGVVGVNWQVSLMSLKFLGPDSGSSFAAIRAVSYAKAMRDMWVATGGAQGANVRVLSNSYGGGGFSQAFLDAIKAAGNSGILFVAAAGNDSTDNDLLPHYPSSYDAPNVVAVAATDRFDHLSSFSNFGGNTVHLAAPGSSILSTTPNNTYGTFSGTSMATPHGSGSAALICAANPNVTVEQLKGLLIFNGDDDSFLSGKTLTQRRLNVAGSLQALAENDVTAPGTATDFRVISQTDRTLSLAWTASGDDSANGQASLYQLSFVDADTGATGLLKTVSPAPSGSPQTVDLTIPYQHTNGTITLREFDNAGNEGIPASLPVSISVLDGDPYAILGGVPVALSTGGTPLGLNFDDRYRENYALPFSFPFFGQNYISVAISTNGNLYFSQPPHDDFFASTADLVKSRMIAGLWDDLDLSTTLRADADVYVVQPDPNRIIFRWQGVPCNWNSICEGGDPVNFEIELESNGNIQTRYGSGNTDLLPVVGISGGEPDAYVIPSHTSKDVLINLTNAQPVTFAYGATLAYSVSGHVADEGNNPVINATITLELDFQGTVSTRTTSTDFNGNYTFGDLECRNSVKVTPSKPGFTFSPLSASLVSTGCVNERATRHFIGFLTANSLVDPTFSPGADSDIQAIAMQPDGKILVGGNFSTIGGGGTGTTPRSRIARLNADGTVDMSFDPGTNGTVTAIAVQADGKILVGGFISQLGGGGTGVTPRKGLGRLNADGTLDTSFYPGADGAVWAIAVQPDSKILLVGNFRNLGGGGTGTTPRNYIGRLNADGTLDTSFNPGANGGVENVMLQPDGKILVAGLFSRLGGGGSGIAPRNGFGRINADGTLDTSFDPATSSAILDFVVQPDGRIVVAGNFNKLSGGSTGTVTRYNIARLSADGTLDPDFDPGANGIVRSLALQADGKILVAGSFSTLGGGGPGTATRNYIGRLNNTAPAVQSLTSSVNGTALEWLRSQASPEVARVTFELSTDGLNYSPLGKGSRIPGGWQLTGLTLATNQNLYIRARGFYATGDRIASESITESVMPINIQSSGGPSVSSLSPPSAFAGGGAFTLLVNGTGFVAGSVIHVNDLDRTTTFVDVTQLSTAIEATEIAATGTLSVTVTNPAPDSGTSNPVFLTVNNPIPTIGNLSPSSKRAGDATFALTVNGTNFNSSSLVVLGGATRPTTLINSNQLLAQIAATDVEMAGTIPITVFNPTPGGGTSTINLPVYGPRAPSARDGFDPGANGAVTVFAAQPDGKILVGGEFTTLGEGGTGTTTRNRLGRLSVDGALDTSFDPGTDANNINAIVVLPDGKILVAGNFTKLGGGGTGNTTRNCIGRLNADGTLDTSFDLGANGIVYDLALQPDGKILLVGNFTTLGGGGSGNKERNFIGRLNADGTLDQFFNPGANGGTEHVVVQADGRILVGGLFSKLGGGGTGTTTRNRIGRLNADGTLDPSFDPGMNGNPQALAVQPDGKIVVGGFFNTLGGGGYGSNTRYSLGRLNADGTLDTSFDPGTNGGVNALAVQPDGKILVGGDFTKLGGGTGTTARKYIGRLNPDGTLDSSFDPGANGPVIALEIQADGKILVGGSFTTLGGGGFGTISRNHIGRLSADGRPDQNLDPGANAPIFAVALQADGKILVAGDFSGLGGGATGTTTRNFIGRLNSDGTLDTSFDPGADTSVFALAVQPDGKILVGGDFTTLGGGGTGTSTRNFIARLNADGTVDTSFDPGANSTVFAFAVQPDGKILVSGAFTTLGGGSTGLIERNHLGRLNPDGTVDMSFDPGANDVVGRLALQADNKILVGGAFTTLGGGGTGTVTRNHIGRLTSDGTLDASFNPGANESVMAFSPQADGKILLGGGFTMLGGGGEGTTPRNHVGRLNADGTLDLSFDPGADNSVLTLAGQADGKVIVGGRFTTLGGGGTGTTPRNFIGRLNPDGTIDESFDPGANGQVSALALQTDGKILVGGYFNTLGEGGTGTATRSKIGRLTNTAAALQSLTSSFGTKVSWLRGQTSPELARVTFELSTDGFTYSPLGNGLRVAGGWQLTGLTLAARQNLYVRAKGFYATGFFTGSGSIAESVRVVNNQTAGGPGVSSLSPSNAIAGGAGFTLTVNGTQFVAGAVIRVNGLDRTTTFVDSTRVSTPIDAADIATAGTLAVTVFNPDPGGGESIPVTFTINNPVPGFNNLAPTSVTAGGPGFVLTVNGGNFLTGSVVRFNGVDRATSFVNSSQLTAMILAADIALAGPYPVTVFNPSPGGGASNSINLAINPVLTTISPATILAGSAGFTLTVNGVGFVGGTAVRLNGVNLPTMFVSSTTLTASVPATAIATVGTYPVTVRTSATANLISNTINIAVIPSITNFTPLTAVAGGPGFTLTIDGCCFISGTVVRWNGSDRATTVVNSSRLTAQIVAADIAVGGVFPITIFIPGPGGGTSLTNNFVVSNPVPAISAISPNWFVPPPFCSGSFTLTVNGTNFVGSSIIRLNGIAHSTTHLSSTQLTAQITEADIQTGGPFSITVQNPTPGGGTSNFVNLFMAEPWSTITSLEPASAMAGSGPFTLTVNGFNFSCNAVVLFNGSNRPTTYVSETKVTAQLTAADVQTVGTFSIAVLKPAPGGAVSNAVDFTVVTPLVYISSISPTSAVAGGPGFTLIVNGSNFFDGIVVRWNESDRPTTVVSSTQLTAAITSADIQSAGTAAVTLFVPGLGSPSSLNFTIFSASGYEADVSPRPNGNNTGAIGISDWTQAGRFSAGLDTPDLGSEFQRADCAPRDTLGNGAITVSDWTQAGRYAAGLDPVVFAGGPTEPTPPTPQPETWALKIQDGKKDASAAATRINLLSTFLPAGQNSTVSIEFEFQGNENAFGFSLMFDPAKLNFVSAEKGSEASAATLNVNKLDAADGRIGLVMALPAGRTFTIGTHQLVVLTFSVRGDGSELPVIGFSDLPIAREVVDLNANTMKAIFKNAAGVNPLEDGQFFVAQHYLDFLNRPADSGGLEYWTKQITLCRTDSACISRRRNAVSAAFFIEQEFQQTGSFVYRLYKAGLGRQLSYAEFAAARGQVIGGANLNASKSAFVDVFVERPEFVQKYQHHPTAAAFIDHLLEQLRESSQVDLSLRRSELLAQYQTGSNTNQSRAQVLQTVIEDTSYKQAEYNPSFVLMEYFGYLRRDPEKGGYDFWLNVLNNREPDNYRGMVCSFITSTEYQRRFNTTISRSNADCSY